MGARPGLLGPSLASARRRFRRYADVLVLVLDVVLRRGGVMMDLEDADHLVDDVAVLVERDGALQTVYAGRLDRVADGVVVDGLPARRHALDGVGNHQDGII